MKNSWNSFYQAIISHKANLGKISKKFLYLLLAAVLIVVITRSVSPKKEKAKKTESIPVKVNVTQLTQLNEIIEYVGDVKADEEAIVYPKVTGKVIEKAKKDGDVVTKGEPLMYVDRDEVGLEYQKAPIESPINGVLGRIYVDVGTNVAPSTACALVVNIDKVKIELDIPEKYLPFVSISQPAQVRVDAYPDEIFNGEVTKVSPVIDISTRSAPVEITLANFDHRLKSGMFAKALLTVKEHKNVAVTQRKLLSARNPMPIFMLWRIIKRC
ncbi:MAG: efflux RND transporter periplasmic adaptor subunit [Candidatus Omnitrophica bacterium]|nr:efflux RND transporter periplasmic adaptor subunit [Candidatus Omnitrophota bacterium]